MRRALVTLALALGALGSSEPASAQSPRHERAAELAAEARERFDAGDAAAAEQLLEEALLQVDDPALYYNLARTRELLEDWEGAASAYRAFTTRRPDDPRIPSVEERLRILEERAAEAAPADPPEPLAEEPVGDAPPEPTPPPADVERGPPAGWSWALLGAGVALAGVGATFGAVSRGQESDAEAAATGAEGAASLADARRNAKLANVGFAAGGALLVGGLVAIFLTRDTVTVAPTEGGARLDLRVRF